MACADARATMPPKAARAKQPAGKQAPDKYAFDVEVEAHDTHELALLAKKLKTPPKSKDQLIKLLKVTDSVKRLGGAGAVRLPPARQARGKE